MGKILSYPGGMQFACRWSGLEKWEVVDSGGILAVDED